VLGASPAMANPEEREDTTFMAPRAHHLCTHAGREKGQGRVGGGGGDNGWNSSDVPVFYGEGTPMMLEKSVLVCLDAVPKCQKNLPASFLFLLLASFSSFSLAFILPPPRKLLPSATCRGGMLGEYLLECQAANARSHSCLPLCSGGASSPWPQQTSSRWRKLPAIQQGIRYTRRRKSTILTWYNETNTYECCVKAPTWEHECRKARATVCHCPYHCQWGGQRRTESDMSPTTTPIQIARPRSGPERVLWRLPTLENPLPSLISATVGTSLGGLAAPVRKTQRVERNTTMKGPRALR